jgi:prepilin-type N-terminal cleavage/methylation domain-containing protein
MPTDKRKAIVLMNRLQKGFTLIELMIVIAIIAILAAILIPNFLHARAESVTAACEGNEKQIATAEEEYAVDNAGTYVTGSPLTLLTTPYLSTGFTDPVAAGNSYSVLTAGAAYGSYEVTDVGGHDTSTTGSLTLLGGGSCGTTCNSVIYAQNSGIHGKP